MENTPKGAFIQRDKETYAIVPRTPMGLITPEILEKIAYVAKKYEIPIIKITSAQRIALIGMKPEIIDQLWNDLDMEVGHAVEPVFHYVQACPGTTVCKFGQQDSLKLGGDLDQVFYGMETPAKFKIGISGCPFNCGESFLRDLGVFGKRTGWTVVVGGNGGARPRIGDIIAEGLSNEQVVDLAIKYVNYYKENAKPKERTSRFIERVGIDNLKQAILEH